MPISYQIGYPYGPRAILLGAYGMVRFWHFYQFFTKPGTSGYRLGLGRLNFTMGISQPIFEGKIIVTKTEHNIFSEKRFLFLEFLHFSYVQLFICFAEKNHLISTKTDLLLNTFYSHLINEKTYSTRCR